MQALADRRKVELFRRTTARVPHASLTLAFADHSPNRMSVHQRTILASAPHSVKAWPAEVALNSMNRTSRLLEEAVPSVQTVPTLSVIVPVFNEARTLREIVESVMLLQVSKQVIIVDDGSTDGTLEVIQSLQEECNVTIQLHERNQGKGAAIQSGIRLAVGDIVIVQDADLEYNPQDILSVIQPILDGEADVVFGSRYLANSHQDQSALHRFGNAVLTGLSNWMTQQKLTDMETCYKAFRRQLLQSIPIEQKRFGFEPEITAKLAKKKIVIREVPIRYQSRSWKEGKKIGVKDLFNTLWCILRYRFG
jgi:glycosyltransferase involved in cell wall biosynthesis